MYCLPVLKRERHRQALLCAATSGSPKFFAGTDSAPHPQYAKECDHGCAGVYTAHAAVELYAEAFALQDKLDALPGFLCRHGAQFYGRTLNRDAMVLRAGRWPIPARIPFAPAPACAVEEGEENEGDLIPLRAGEELQWRAEVLSTEELGRLLADTPAADVLDLR